MKLLTTKATENKFKVYLRTEANLKIFRRKERNI